MESGRPGSEGEHALQERYATFKRAAAFYDKQMLDYLNPLMREFIAGQEMVFVATADSHGEADASFRAGSPGFVRVIDERTIMYPEYRGNGVMASLGNISENANVGLLFVDFFRSTVGLHVNGTARIVENDAVTAFAPMLTRMAGVDELHDHVSDKKKTPERWVIVEVVEAYIHCSKHIPLLRKLDKDIDWGTDNEVRKGGDYFKAKHDARPWVTPKETGDGGRGTEVPTPIVCDAEPEPVAETVAGARRRTRRRGPAGAGRRGRARRGGRAGRRRKPVPRPPKPVPRAPPDGMAVARARRRRGRRRDARPPARRRLSAAHRRRHRHPGPLGRSLLGSDPELVATSRSRRPATRGSPSP